MKTDLPQNITGQEYLALSEDKRAVYRPIDSKYEHLPKFARIFYILGGVSLLLYIIMMLSESFSDWFNMTVSSAFRIVFAHLTSWLPFSLGEFIIWMLPIFLFLALRHALRKCLDSWRCVIVFIGTVMSVIVLLFSIFVFNFAAGYRGTGLDEKLDIDRTNIGTDELYELAGELAEKINEIESEVDFGADGFSVMPYSISDMNGLLIEAYDRVSDKYDFISNTPTRLKPVLLSEVMSHMHITGVYSFFTGEANINVGFPDYTIPFTAAHELAHQRGIAKEDEANFVAYLVCMESDDLYIQYCAYLNMFEYVCNALDRADKQLYRQVYGELDGSVQREMAAYGDFYEKYRHSAARVVSGTVNDAFLQSQGTAGTVSYGMVVELAVGYHRKLHAVE